MDGIGDPCMPTAPIQARNYVIACYAVSLIRGETILNMKIRYKTVCNYVTDAIKLHTSRTGKVKKLPSPRNADIDYIDIVLKAVKKYETMADRREMIYDDMVLNMIRRSKSLPQDSLEAALIDWIILGRYTGYRCSEWCQSTQSKYDEIDHPLWTGHKASAFLAEDVTFYDKSQRPFYDLTNVTIDDVYFVKIRYRHQKNDNNGEIIPYEKDSGNPDLCPVYAALRIRQRATRLAVPVDCPIGVYKPKKPPAKAARSKASRKVTKKAPAKTARSKVSCKVALPSNHLAPGSKFLYITRKQVDKYLQLTGKAVFKLKVGDPLLARWTSHSIRVTACNLLHRQNMTDSYIQQRLRWKSLAFRDYLRNTIYSAAQHKAALHISANNIPTLHNRASGRIVTQTRTKPEELERIVRVGLSAGAV